LAGHLKFDFVTGIPIPGGHPKRRRRSRLGDSGIDGLSEGTVHAGEGQQMSPRIDNRNAFRHTIQRRLFNSLVQDLEGPSFVNFKNG